MAALLEVRVVNRLSDLDPLAWDHMAYGQPFASYRWTRLGEAVWADHEPQYVVLSYAGEPIARANFWLIRRDHLPVTSRIARAILQGILTRWPLLACRTPLVDRSGLVLPNTSLKNEALRTLIDTVQALGRKRRTSFVLFDYLDQTLPWPAPFSSLSVAEPSTRLDIEWTTFESYAKHLSPGARKDYHRHTNRARDLGIEVTAYDHVIRPQEALPLIRQVERHHQMPPQSHAQRLLEMCNQVPMTWLTAQIGDRLVGCGLLLGDGDARMLTMLGLDYSVQYVYFQLLYAAIRESIQSGARVLYGGSGANDLKRRLGFALWQNNQVAVASHQWIFRQLTKQLA